MVCSMSPVRDGPGTAQIIPVDHMAPIGRMAMRHACAIVVVALAVPALFRQSEDVRGAQPHCPVQSPSLSGVSISNTCRKYAMYAGSSHMFLPGESDSFATGCPLQRTIFITICSGW